MPKVLRIEKTSDTSHDDIKIMFANGRMTTTCVFKYMFLPAPHLLIKIWTKNQDIMQCEFASPQQFTRARYLIDDVLLQKRQNRQNERAKL